MIKEVKRLGQRVVDVIETLTFILLGGLGILLAWEIGKEVYRLACRVEFQGSIVPVIRPPKYTWRIMPDGHTHWYRRHRKKWRELSRDGKANRVAFGACLALVVVFTYFGWGEAAK